MAKQVHVFLSSTWQDLQPEREAVERALHRMRSTIFSGMEYFGSRPDTPRDVSLAEVDRSDIYVGIFAHRYGSGITEAEYRRAQERSLPCLIYLKDDSVPVPPAYIERDAGKAAQLDALKNELKANHTVSFFRSPDDLAAQVAADLHNLLGHTAPAPEEQPSRTGSTYHVTINKADGVAIGDGAQVIKHADKQPGKIAPSSSSAATAESMVQRLYQLLTTQYDLEELRTLCFKLGVEYDDLRGEGRSAKARELIRSMERRGQVHQLLQLIERNG
jgi:hypothetical protein